MLTRPPAAHLTTGQKEFFAEQGYLVVEGALDRAACAHFAALVGGLDRAHRAAHGSANDAFVEIRNAIAKEPRFLDLLDWPGAFPLVAELMGPNLQLNTSHTMVRPPQPPDTPASYKRIGWHRDGSADVQAIHGTYPWVYTKIGYFLSDLSRPGMGNLRVIPGSHKRAACPPALPGTLDPEGAVELCTRPGDAVIFQQRLWHAVGPNVSGFARVNIYMGYCYRWMKPLDYLAQPLELLARATPIQRQLLGEERSEMAFWLPKDEDLPLKAWLQEHLALTAVAG